MTTTNERQRLALRAEAALAAYLAECGEMLWPDERRELQTSRKFLSKEAGG